MYTSLLILIGCINLSYASWSSEELTLYDLIEELNINFYDYFGIKQDATINEIKKAYRKLSLEWHPDRNKAENASEKFRQIVAIYDILKSNELREKYNNVLEFGLPDWRQPIFYYRRMRKLSSFEALAVLLIFCTLGHAAMMYGQYYEKKIVFAQKLNKKKIDSSEKQALEQALAEYLPKVTRLLPFLIVEAIYETIWVLYVITKRKLQHPVEEIKLEEEEKVIRKPTAPRQEFHYEIATDLKAVSVNDVLTEQKYKEEVIEKLTKNSKAPWEFEELSLLIRLSTEKYPPGTPNRWDLMAGQLNRTAEDVTAMAGKMKNMKQEQYTKLIRGQQSAAVNDSSVSVIAEVSTECVWEQHEQKLFEAALQKFPKGTEERWEQIAEAVPGKTKEQCITRFKQLAALIRRRKTAA